MPKQMSSTHTQSAATILDEQADPLVKHISRRFHIFGEDGKRGEDRVFVFEAEAFVDLRQSVGASAKFRQQLQG